MIEEFKTRFYGKFSGVTGHMFNRWPAFEFIANHLLNKKEPICIIETGTVRTRDDWAGNGQSTILWDWIIEKTGGHGFSIDISPASCENARQLVKRMKIINEDSLSALKRLSSVSSADLVYLDSYDWSQKAGPRSALHHVTELGTIWDRLPQGCLVAADDCHSDFQGKHVLVAEFFRLMKIPPIHKGYVTVWEKALTRENIFSKG
jgi:hypothetical protein